MSEEYNLLFELYDQFTAKNGTKVQKTLDLNLVTGLKLLNFGDSNTRCILHDELTMTLGCSGVRY